jgi:hypothetical protein
MELLTAIRSVWQNGGMPITTGLLRDGGDALCQAFQLAVPQGAMRMPFILRPAIRARHGMRRRLPCVSLATRSPIDLIPDFLPVVGYLDEVVILPLGILAVVS